MLKEPSLKT